MVNVLHPPASVIASWPAPNHVNPANEGPALIVVGIIMTILGTSIVCVRLYARAFITRALGIDDILIVLAAIAAIVLTSLNIVTNVRYYTGYHIWDAPHSILVPHRINVWASVIMSVLTLTFTKVSILLFYRRLSVSFSRAFVIATWVGIIYNITYCTAFILGAFLLCRPFQAYWLQYDSTFTATHSYSCGSEATYEPLLVATSTIGDLYTTIVPLVLIFSLDLPSKQKKALYFLFGLGFLVVVTGFVRVAFVYLTLNVTYDFTWTLWKMWVISQVEVWMAICVASAPALKPVVKRFRAVVEQSFSGGSHGRQLQQGDADGYAEEYRESMAIKERNDSASTEGERVKIETGTVMGAEEATDSKDDHYCVTAQTVKPQDVLRGSGKAQVKGKWWLRRKDGPWNSVESLEPC